MSDPRPEKITFTRRRLMTATGAGGVMLGVARLIPAADGASISSHAATQPGLATAAQPDIRGALRHADSVAADATRLPAPITRDHPIHHEIELTVREVTAMLAPGTKFTFMTWDGQVPGPMIRVRQDDTVTLTVRNPKSSAQPHNVDMHAIYGTGGGSVATWVAPGESKTERFKCLYPGAFIYHCAVQGLDEHISRGMFGMIVVEPHDGLPKVDREFYLGQHELYTRQPFGSQGHLDFDVGAMIREEPNYVLFNGAVDGYTRERLGRLTARTGERLRVFMVCGGPNLSSSFHPIGNVWSRCWPQGALASPPLRYVQTQPVPPGSCFVGEIETPVPATIKLVDHALTRVARKGLLAEIEVAGPADPAIFMAPA